MLVLSRKKGESILIGDGIELVVLEVRGERVRLGIRAPDTVRILREEILTQWSAEIADRRERHAGVN